MKMLGTLIHDGYHSIRARMAQKQPPCMRSREAVRIYFASGASVMLSTIRKVPVFSVSKVR